MGMEFYGRTVPQARVLHKCEGCGQPIEVGKKYSYETGKWDGDFFARPMHLECFEVMNEILNALDDNEFDWDGLTDWWQNEKCSVCKHRHHPDIDDDCFEMTHMFWCAKWKPEQDNNNRKGGTND